MQLADFITENMEAILQEWESFAATLSPAAEEMSDRALRDHAPQILAAISKDMKSAQSWQEQSDKARGRATDSRIETAAQTHGLLRALHNFDINQLVAEYRALRASVTRLWIDEHPQDDLEVEELIRFNEAIDQAIAESVDYFQDQIERSRNLFLGAFGHDLRSPLNTIMVTSGYLSELGAGEKVTEAARRINRSGDSMRALLDDLADFNRTQLGIGIGISPSEGDLAEELASEVDQLCAAYPDREIRLDATGNCRGSWDASRLKQLTRNLVTNAIQYGYAETPVVVTLASENDAVRLSVRNEGPVIDPSSREQLFEPLKRGMAEDADDQSHDGLGLGLFIVREIAQGHGGDVQVESDDGRTTFIAILPQQKDES